MILKGSTRFLKKEKKKKKGGVQLLIARVMFLIYYSLKRE